MPINNVSNSIASLPVAGRDNRLRLQSLDVEDQASNRQNTRRPEAEVIQPSDDVQRVVRSAESTDSSFRPIPSFDDLSSTSREALQTYISTANATEVVPGNGAELIVGVDTFV